MSNGEAEYEKWYKKNTRVREEIPKKKSSEPVDGQPGRPNKGPLADGGLQVKTGKFRSARTYTKTIKSDCNINRYNKCHRKGKMRTS